MADKNTIPPFSNQTTSTAMEPSERFLQRSHPNSFLNLLNDQIKEQNLTKWTTIAFDTSLQLFTLQKNENLCPLRIKRTVTLCADLSWHVYVCGRLLDPTVSDVFSDLPFCVNDINSLLSILQRISSAGLCTGNPDPDIIQLIEHEGGSFRGTNQDVVATLE